MVIPQSASLILILDIPGNSACCFSASYPQTCFHHVHSQIKNILCSLWITMHLPVFWIFKALHNLACPTQPIMLSFSISQCALLFPCYYEQVRTSGYGRPACVLGVMQSWSFLPPWSSFFQMLACMNSSHPSKHPLATMSSLVVPSFISFLFL